jgi:hypothetical protein
MYARTHFARESTGVVIFLELPYPIFRARSQKMRLPSEARESDFDTIERARLFLGVFEKVYRFTPFTEDAQPRIRNRCPLELAGYDISQMPMASLCAGSSFAWPLAPVREEVPKP